MFTTISSSRRGRRLAAMALATSITALLLAGCTTSAGGGDGGGSAEACAAKVDPKDAKLILGVGDVASAYWQEVIAGAQAVADSVGAELTVFDGKFDGQTMLNNLTSALAGGGANTAIVVDPSSNAFAKPIVESAQQAGARIVTLWQRPTENHPWDFGGGCWVAHTAFDGTEGGRVNSEELFAAMGGSGNIVALQGVPDVPTNKQRLYGLGEALKATPSVTLLDMQTAFWTAPNAQTAINSLLSKFPNQIDGIFSANDDMAVGAVEALRSAGLNGQIPVTGFDGSADMLQLIKAGDALSTVKTDAYGQGAYAMAIAYAALIGDIDVNDLTHEQRDFYLKQQLVTAANVDEALAITDNFDPADYAYDVLKKDFWASATGQIDDDTWIPTPELPLP